MKIGEENPIGNKTDRYLLTVWNDNHNIGLDSRALWRSIVRVSILMIVQKAEALGCNVLIIPYTKPRAAQEAAFLLGKWEFVSESWVKAELYPSGTQVWQKRRSVYQRPRWWIGWLTRRKLTSVSFLGRKLMWMSIRLLIWGQWVRIPPGSPIFSIGVSFNGRTLVSKTKNAGSTPAAPANLLQGEKVPDC